MDQSCQVDVVEPGWYLGKIIAYDAPLSKHTISWLQDDDKDSLVDLMACKMCTEWRFVQSDEDIVAQMKELNGDDGDNEPTNSNPPAPLSQGAVDPVGQVPPTIVRPAPSVSGLQLFDQLNSLLHAPEPLAAVAPESVLCPECKESMSATGCHHCAGCDRVMHAFCGIAAPGSGEGFGAKRVCTSCQGQNMV